MKKIKMLVNSVVNGSVGTQIVAGVVAVTVLGGAAFGGYKVYSNVKEQKQEQLKVEREISNKKKSISDNIKVLEDKLAKLPEDEDTSVIKSDLEVLKGIDIENDYENGYSRCKEVSKHLEEVVGKYEKEMTNFRTELSSLDVSLFNEEESKTFKEHLNKFISSVDNTDYKNYKTIYEEVKNKYNELVGQAQSRVSSEEVVVESNNDSNKETANNSQPSKPNDNQSNNSQTQKPSDSQSNNSQTQKPSGSINNDSSDKGSVGNGQSNGDGSDFDPSIPGGGKETGSAPVEEPVKPEPAPTPSIPSGWKSDIASQVVRANSNVNTNNYDTSGHYFSQTQEMYNSYSSIAQQFANGSLSQSGVISALQGVTGEFSGFRYSYGNAIVSKFNVSGCSYDAIRNYIDNTFSYVKPGFVSCSVYYDSSSNTSTVYYIRLNIQCDF